MKRLFKAAVSSGLIVTIALVTLIYINIKDIEIIKRELQVQNETLDKMLPRDVVVTAYSSNVNQTDDTPNITAFMTNPKRWTVAVSRDLLLEGWLPEDKVYFFRLVNGKFKGIGVFAISDIMHERKRDQFDIWVPDEKFAHKIGRMENVKAVLIKIED